MLRVRSSAGVVFVVNPSRLRSSELLRKARFSPCRTFRWWLWRRWDPQAPLLLFIGLNPSMADGRCDDPTTRRLMGLASRWGFGTIEVLNLYARITADPARLRHSEDPVGDQADPA